MKIKVLKENGIEARSLDNAKQKHYAKGSVVPIKKCSSDLFDFNLTHFFDFDGYVFTLKGDEILSV